MTNYGYCCINMALREQKPSITTNRSMIKRTFVAKGADYASELIVENVKDLRRIIKWNEANGLKLYRMSSDIMPWMSEYNISDLKRDMAKVIEAETAVFGVNPNKNYLFIINFALFFNYCF